MNVLIVGCDKTGKSTLVEKLRQKTRWPVFKFSNPKDAHMAVITCVNGLSAADKFENVIFDRFCWPDDIVYSPVITGKSYDNNARLAFKQYVEPEMIKRGFLLLYCHAEIEDIRARYAACGGDDYLMFEKVPAILAGYADFLQETKLPYRTLDSSQLSPDEMAYYAVDFMQLRGAEI